MEVNSTYKQIIVFLWLNQKNIKSLHQMEKLFLYNIQAKKDLVKGKSKYIED